MAFDNAWNDWRVLHRQWHVLHIEWRGMHLELVHVQRESLFGCQ